MDIQNDWVELKFMAGEKDLILNQRQSFFIFPNLTTDSPLNLLILTVRNLIAYQLHLIVQNYALFPEDEPLEIKEYLKKFANLMNQNQNYRFLLNETTVVDDSAYERLKEINKDFPIIPDSINEQIKITDQMRKKASKTLFSNIKDKLYPLYLLSIEWMNLLGCGILERFPIQKPLEYASLHLKMHSSRVTHHSDRSVKWGEEFDSYYNTYIKEGFCEQTARSKARKKFILAHPVPVTDAELLADIAFPGTSRQSLRRYQKEYLQSKMTASHKT